MKFSEMPYTRPDPDKVKKELSELTGRLKNAGSYEEARAVFLEKEEKDCVLIADCILTEELLDRARVRGYTRARTGIFRYRPWERVLLTKRSVHCGGCAHNCLLSNPGCGIGRDKAARKSD